jgi:hypothetical protein
MRKVTDSDHRMKLPVALITLFVALLVGFFAVLYLSSPDKPIAIEADAFTALSDEKKVDLLLKSMEKNQLPQGAETISLTYIMGSDNTELRAQMKKSASRIANLSHFLSETSYALFTEDRVELGLESLKLARELFPSDPKVLAVTGIAAVLAGRQEEARTFLEQAVSWDRDDTRTLFYLGGLLLESTSTADKVRGKSLLYRVCDRQDSSFSESAGILLLIQADLILTDEEVVHLFEVLDILNAFREDNEHLNPGILRRLANKAAAQAPEFAVNIAELVLAYSDGSPNDIIGFVDLVQNFGDFEAAGKKLTPLVESLEAAPDPDLPLDRLAKIRTLQAFASEDWMQGEILFEQLMQDHADSASTLELFQQLLDFPVSIPLDEQRKVFTAFTDLGDSSVELGLPVLDRLLEVQPLRKEAWLDLAVERYLDKDPLTVARWLTIQDASARIIEHFSGKTPPLKRFATRALVEAYLIDENTEAASAVLVHSGATLNPAVLQFYRARIASIEGATEEALEYWSASHNAAISTGSFSLIQNLGFLALELNQPISALQTLQTAFSAGIPFNESQALRLLDLTLRFGSLPQTLDVATFLHESYPQRPVHLNNLAYFKFVASEEVEGFVERMRALYDEFPEINEYRLTLALGLLQSGRKNEANRLLQGMQMDWDAASDRGLLIYAAVLAQNGQAILAENIVRDIDPEVLIPEERAFLGSL